jgi:hypothetical protein
MAIGENLPALPAYTQSWVPSQSQATHARIQVKSDCRATFHRLQQFERNDHCVTVIVKEVV